MATLQQKTISGVVWSTVQRFGSMAITFASNIVLARLLSPSDFGCIGMLMIFISLANTFIDGGFGSALIQKKLPTKEDYSTIFYWNIFLAIILYSVLFISSPAIARFYKIPLLADVLKVQGIVLLFNSLCIIQHNQLRKQLQFKKLAIVEIVAALLSLAVAIVTACYGWGVWSLVAQQLSLGLFKAILLWFLNSWRPILVFSWKSFKELFKFGGFMLLSSLFATLSNEIQGLLVGRRFTSATMGLYTQAYRLEGSAATAVSSVIDQVTYPVMAAVQDDRQKLISALKRFIQIPAYICSPIMALMIVIAKPVIILLYSAKWIDCVPYFQILCTAGLAVCLQGSANNSIAAIGKSNIFFKWTIIKRTLTIVLCVAGIILWGMKGLLWSCVLGAWSVYFINAFLVERHVGYSFWNQLMDILPFAVMSAAIGILVYWIGAQLSLHMYVVAAIQVLLFGIIYLLMSYVFKIDAFNYIKSFVFKKRS